MRLLLRLHSIQRHGRGRERGLAAETAQHQRHGREGGEVQEEGRVYHPWQAETYKWGEGTHDVVKWMSVPVPLITTQMGRPSGAPDCGGR